MTPPAMDALDAIMAVMETAFDPAYGEAWTRRQVSDSLCLPHTHFLLCDQNGLEPDMPADAAGFVMSRHVVGEEELLLIAVKPEARGKGVGAALMKQFIAHARSRGATHQFLEMRDGNPAERLYLRLGFKQIGRRRDYYRSGKNGPLDAITFARTMA